MDDPTDTILVACGLSVIGLCLLLSACVVIRYVYCANNFEEALLEDLENV